MRIATEVRDRAFQHSLAHRRFDKAIARLGNWDRDQEREHQLRNGELDVRLLANDLVDRPMKQIQPIAALTNPREHWITEQIASNRASVCRGSDQKDRCNTGEQEATAEQRRVVHLALDKPHGPEQEPEHAHAEHRQHIEAAALVAQRSAYNCQWSPQHREAGTK